MHTGITNTLLEDTGGEMSCALDLDRNCIIFYIHDIEK